MPVHPAAYGSATQRGGAGADTTRIGKMRGGKACDGKMRAARRVVALAAILTLSMIARAGMAVSDPPSGIDGAAVSEAPASKAFNWEKLNQEATALLSQYIRIDTTNPPGNEL